MRLMTSTRGIHAPFDCERWTGCKASVILGVRDKYSVTVPLPQGDGGYAVLEKALDLLMRYRIFPDSRMRYRVCTNDGRIRSGALIVQRIFLGPLALEMAVRVLDVFDRLNGERQIGFRYVTLEGHVERGLATFRLCHRPGHEITFAIETWSRPGNFLVWLAYPISRLIQRRSNQQALANFLRQLS
jgi:uncharacterized protein (UPF0548 family)